jgi:hypothetical protein
MPIGLKVKQEFAAKENARSTRHATSKQKVTPAKKSTAA